MGWTASARSLLRELEVMPSNAERGVACSAAWRVAAPGSGRDVQAQAPDGERVVYVRGAHAQVGADALRELLCSVRE